MGSSQFTSGESVRSTFGDFLTFSCSAKVVQLFWACLIAISSCRSVYICLRCRFVRVIIFFVCSTFLEPTETVELSGRQLDAPSASSDESLFPVRRNLLTHSARGWCLTVLRRAPVCNGPKGFHDFQLDRRPIPAIVSSNVHPQMEDLNESLSICDQVSDPWNDPDQRK